MKTKITHSVYLSVLSTLVWIGFSSAVKKSMHADEAEILHFEYTNFDGGTQFINDLDTAFFPFINTSGHDITLINVYSKNKYFEWPYELISPKKKITFKDQQRDTLFFRRINRGELKAGHYDQSWELTFEGTDKKQYLNIFCELRSNQGELTSERVVLPTVNQGEKIYFESTVRNVGKTAVKISPMNEWNDKGFKPLDNYPVNIEPGDSVRLHFEVQTDGFAREYLRTAWFNSNADDMDRMTISYSGELIAETYASILFDSTSLTLHTYQGGPGDYEFWFTNDGTAPLIISMVKTSCGCLVPSYYPKEPVMPGKRDRIKIHYDTSRVGPINKTATVYSNASDYPLTLRVLGSIKEC